MKNKGLHYQQRNFLDHDSSCSALPDPMLSDTDRDSLLQALLAVSSAKDIGPQTLNAVYDSGLLAEIASNNEEAVQATLIRLSRKLRPSSLDAIRNRRSDLVAFAAKTTDQLREHGIVFVPKGHRDYPPSLLLLNEPPRWIFVQGSPAVLHSTTSVAVVGTRQASPEGLRLARRCGRELATRGLVVLSGLAKGIDEQAHKGAIDVFGQTTAILGHGLLSPSIKERQDLVKAILDCDGAVVSEYFPGDLPSRQRFLRRNELQVALSKVVIPVESPSLESGTGATIRRALQIGRTLMGVIPEDTSSTSLLATQDRLREMKVEVYKVMGRDSAKFWQELKEKLGLAYWNDDLVARQNRALRSIMQLFVSLDSRIRVDVEMAERLRDMLSKWQSGREPTSEPQKDNQER